MIDLLANFFNPEKISIHKLRALSCGWVEVSLTTLSPIINATSFNPIFTSLSFKMSSPYPSSCQANVLITVRYTCLSALEDTSEHIHQLSLSSVEEKGIELVQPV